jgi:hypothetical protein
VTPCQKCMNYVGSDILLQLFKSVSYEEWDYKVKVLRNSLMHCFSMLSCPQSFECSTNRVFMAFILVEVKWV